MNLLFLNVGRRCELVESFQRALTMRGGGKIFGSDISALAPALQVVDQPVLFPHGDSPDFGDTLLEYCRCHNIGLVVPTIDPDLLRLDALAERFAAQLPDCRLLVSPSFTLRHARDKRLSRKLFAELGAEVPEEVSLNDPKLLFPLFVKPFDGSGGDGAGIVLDRAALLSRLQENPELMVEKIVTGPEYTVDVLCDFFGKALCAVPRRRIRIRSGEVVQGVVERNRELEELALKLAEGFQAIGPVTLQFRRPDEGCFVAMEINARMGGGLPLTIAAGGDWPGWILDMCMAKTPDTMTNIAEGLVMTRCDRSFFITQGNLEKLKDPHNIYRPSLSVDLRNRLCRAKGWLFDMDDTLYPERDFVFSGYRAVAAKVHADFKVDIEGELRQRFIQGERGDLFSRALRFFGLPFDEGYVETLVHVYRSHSPDILPFVDVIPTLEFLKARGAVVGLVSDGWMTVQQSKMDSLNIAKYFDSIVFTDSINGVKSWKPAPDGFQKCLAELDLEASDAVFVGDNPKKDFIGARMLGMNTIRIRRRGAEHEFNRSVSTEFEPDVSYSSFSEICNLFEK